MPRIIEPGISTDEMNVIKTYLDNGGNLYLNGVRYAFRMADPASPYYTSGTMEFFTNYLHSSYVLREHSAIITQGISGDPIADKRIGDDESCRWNKLPIQSIICRIIMLIKYVR